MRLILIKITTFFTHPQYPKMFLATFLIMLREGLEGALIVSIIASYLKQTGNQKWMKYVWLGVAAAVILCLIVGTAMFLVLEEIPQRQQELFEATIAVIAVVILTYMVFWMRKASRNIKRELMEKIDANMNQSKGQGYLMVSMAFFAVAREGIESLFFLFSFFEQDSTNGQAFFGAILGLVTAILLAAAIYRGSVKLNLQKFFKYTGVFILFVAAGLAAGALKSFHEAGLWNSLQTTAYDASTQMFSTHTILGSILAGLFGYNDHPTHGELIVYFLYLIPMLIFFFWPAKKSSVQQKTAT